MSNIAEVLAAVRQMSDDDREAVRRALDEIEERAFQEERIRATADFHARGLTDDDIDEAVRRHRYESRP